ncbi:hypothetical protein [Azospirillum sp. B4]|uniref:hypothetical protein n=1 Tax=Azospirillum sp. B4 TaxID=95605 RepID=UPI0003464CC4|nr:hypothetical protein [Azospirillum sp. B4]
MRAAALILLAFLSAATATAGDAVPGAARIVTLALPRPLVAEQDAWIMITLGPIGHAQVDIRTADGRLLGSAVPFGQHQGAAGGTHVIPLPADAVRGDHVTLRLTITQPGAPSRAPTAAEVRDVAVTLGRP